MGNTPQYVNQGETQQVQPYNSQFGAQPSPARFLLVSINLKRQVCQAHISHRQPRCPSRFQLKVESTPEQIPNVARARECRFFYLDHVILPWNRTCHHKVVAPLWLTIKGNTSPKFARLTFSHIPSSSNALSSTGLSLVLIMQPLASLQAGESQIPILEFGDIGPPRYRRYRAYIDPFIVFRSRGNKLVCDIYTFPNNITPDYFAPTDPTRTRIDRY